MRSARSWLKANVIKNARKEAPFWDKIKGDFYEVDIWIPSLQLGFEFQDLYHFTSTWYSQRPLSVIKNVDKSKNELIHGSSVTLICVPCWWDGNHNQLAATIKFHRPDLLSHLSLSPLHLIPLNPPLHFFSLYSVPELGEVMLPSFIDSVSKFGSELSSSNSWWLGEKYDGIRCVWNPISKILHSRRGLTFNFPPSCVSLIPNVFIDGELWCGRGRYLETQKVLIPDDFDWASFRVIAFDNPENEMKKATFEKRYGRLVDFIPRTHPFVVSTRETKKKNKQKKARKGRKQEERRNEGKKERRKEGKRGLNNRFDMVYVFAARMMCNNNYMMTKVVKTIIEDGGEGAILQKCKSLYEEGRSNSVIKLKTANRDSEALVVNVSPSSLTLKLPTGVEFEVEKEGEEEVKEGEIITFEHDNSSRGQEKPVNPKIIRVRRDMNWNDVLSDFKQENTIKDFSSKPNNYWKTEEGKRETRKELEDFARSQNLDPFNPLSWYSFLAKDVSHLKGVAGNNKSFSSLLVSVFPDIGLEPSKFTIAPRGHFSDPAQRKAYFDNFASLNHFDPLIPDNWYSVQAQSFLEQKSGATILQLYYNGSFKKALIHLYPNIGWDSSRFLPGAYWANIKNRKDFFDSYAAENSFDPLVANNWHSSSFLSIFEKQHAGSVLQYYQGDIGNALSKVYPGISIDPSKFINSQKGGQYTSEESRRLFFDTFATDNHFDPLIADNWHKISSKKLFSTKDIGIVLSYYQGSIANALETLYPSLQIDKDIFSSRILGQWTDINNHKQFFNEFAKDNQFDPLVAKNWHFVKPSQILARRGAQSVLNYYQRNFAKALVNIYPNIGLKVHHLAYCQDYSMWDSKDARKDFFESFAKDNNFDPLVNTNWYSVSHKFKQQLLDRRHSKPLLNLYDGDANAALLDAFPNIGLLVKLR